MRPRGSPTGAEGIPGAARGRHRGGSGSRGAPDAACRPSRHHAPALRDDRARPASDLVDRCFAAEGPNEIWVADITYIPTWAGFVYLAIVLDVWSRRVVGWAIAGHLRTELVLEALQVATSQRRPRSVIHHSDQGCQDTAVNFGKRCEQLGVRPSMGSVGDAYDNAITESFFATLECELLDRTRFQTQAEARMAVFEWIEGWYNSHRRHSSIGYLSPIDFERRQAATGELGGSAPEPPMLWERRGGQEGPGLQSRELSTEPR